MITKSDEPSYKNQLSSLKKTLYKLAALEVTKGKLF